MSRFYTPRRYRNLYDPQSDKPFKVSRSKIDLYISCPRCFYLDRRLGVAQPPGFPFNLNNAVDTLLKKEFDLYREQGKPHPLMEEHGLDMVPFAHEKMEEWRDSLRRGIQYLHEPTQLVITGGIDDVWVNSAGELVIVDYKATSKNAAITLNADWQIVYKRQMEVYQWLFRRNGFEVSSTGYFVYCNGLATKERFDKHLDFDIYVLSYKGDDSWVDTVLTSIKNCLEQDKLPRRSGDCDFCNYRKAIHDMEKEWGKTPRP